MSQLDPANTTAGDLILASLKLAGVIGVGQTASAEDNNDVWALLQWMLEEWARKRWLIFALATVSKVSTGAVSYTLGPGGDLDTGVGSFRPDKIESAFLRQLIQASPNQVDYPLTIIPSKEDYNQISLKGLSSFPQAIFYDPEWPLGRIYPWPVPQSVIYGVYVTVKTTLQWKFPALATVLTIPYEYYNAIVFNLALRCRVKYSIPSFPGDRLPGLAKDSLNTLRGGNTAISTLRVPNMGGSNNGYNIFSDQASR